jgi:hypothetical protein
VLGLGSAALAAELFTPPLGANVSGDELDCQVLNSGKSAIVVVLDIIDVPDGTSLVQFVKSVTVPPGEGFNVRAFDFGSRTRAYCKVSGSFSKRSVLLTLCAKPFSVGVDSACRVAVTAP